MVQLRVEADKRTTRRVVPDSRVQMSLYGPEQEELRTSLPGREKDKMKSCKASPMKPFLS